MKHYTSSHRSAAVGFGFHAAERRHRRFSTDSAAADQNGWRAAAAGQITRRAAAKEMTSSQCQLNSIWLG